MEQYEFEKIVEKFNLTKGVNDYRLVEKKSSHAEIDDVCKLGAVIMRLEKAIIILENRLEKLEEKKKGRVLLNLGNLKVQKKSKKSLIKKVEEKIKSKKTIRAKKTIKEDPKPSPINNPVKEKKEAIKDSVEEKKEIISDPIEIVEYPIEDETKQLPGTYSSF